MEKILKDIIDVLEKETARFGKKLPALQKQMLDELQPLLKEFKISGGKILNNVHNLKLLGTIQNKLEKVILNKEYTNGVKTLLDAFDQLSDLNMQYFKSFNQKFTPSETLPLIKQLMVEKTINDLVGQGMKQNVIAPVRSIIQQNTITGGSYADFQEEVANYIKGTPQKDGVMVRHAGQIAKDAINQYNAQYHDALAQDLNFDWLRYVGSNLETSREFCVLLTEKEWVHRSELQTVINGTIDGKELKLSNTTKLPVGMIPGTNVDNFKVRRGGYNCGHQAFWVPDSSVPAQLLAKFPRAKK